MWKLFLEHGNKLPSKVREEDMTDIMVLMGRYEYEAEMQVKYDEKQEKKREHKQKLDKARNKGNTFIKLIQKGKM